MNCLIVNADDFGASCGVNRGIIEAHRDGIVTSTSLMVNMPAAPEAARLSLDWPLLGIGLHVALTSEAEKPIVDLDDAGKCRQNLQDQFSRFLDLMGRPPTHLDSHHNVQRDRRLEPLFRELAHQHSLPLRDHSPARYFSSFYGQWDGETHLEQLSVDNLLHMLATEIRNPVTELSCHPGYVDAEFPSLYGIEREAELRTLCDPEVRQFLEQEQVRLINFRDLAGMAASLP